MNDLHDRFRSWIAAGSLDELPRDVAVHASGCEACMRGAAAIDALSVIDPGAALMPPMRGIVPSAGTLTTTGVMRIGSGVMAVGVILVAGIVAVNALAPGTPDGVGGRPAASPAEAVLGGQPNLTPEPLASTEDEASVTATPSATSAESQAPTASEEAATFDAIPTPTPDEPVVIVPPRGTPTPTDAVTPPPTTPTPRPSPTVAPPTPTPTLSPPPTPPPTPVPTPSPTPTPSCDPVDPECLPSLPVP